MKREELKIGNAYFTEIKIGVIGRVKLLSISGMNATIRYIYQGESNQTKVDTPELFETEIECRKYYSRFWK